MANRLQLRRGTSAPGGIFYEGEPVYDKTNKVLYVGDSGASGSGNGSAVAMPLVHILLLQKFSIKHLRLLVRFNQTSMKTLITEIIMFRSSTCKLVKIIHTYSTKWDRD